MKDKAERVTFGKGNDQLLYFTTTSLDEGDESLWFISDRDGSPNVYCQDLKTGACAALTSNRNGRQWQYQGFGGEREKGLAVWSMALDDKKKMLYTIQDNQILAVDANGKQKVLAEIDAGQTTAFIDVSSCGNWLCVPTTDERALLRPSEDGNPVGAPRDIDKRCQDEGLCSFLDVYHTGTGKRELHLCVPRCWITHVQFHPMDPSRILYNHEWTVGSDGNRRMWLWDGTRHHCLRPQNKSCSQKDWISHEVWSPDGKSLMYHGAFFEGAALIGHMDPHSFWRKEIALPQGWHRYGHFQIHPTRGDLLVSDGYYQTDDDEPGKGRWLSLQKVNWQNCEIEWIPICRHESSWKVQDDHPHPIFNHAGNEVYFTGGTPEGGRAVYRVAVS
ncbi:MAG: hypothetical protein JNM63_11215 [Spirochaetia bacterium]|nr:hypothetical protein [Spirochaetia bacterium]